MSAGTPAASRLQENSSSSELPFPAFLGWSLITSKGGKEAETSFFSLVGGRAGKGAGFWRQLEPRAPLLESAPAAPRSRLFPQSLTPFQRVRAQFESRRSGWRWRVFRGWGGHWFSSRAQTCCGHPVRPFAFFSAPMVSCRPSG